MELTWADAIEKVLQDAGEPLHYVEILNRIIREGLRENIGATPSYTVNATLTQDRQSSRPRFTWVSRGVYGLAEWQTEQPPIEVIDEEEGKEPSIDSPLGLGAYGLYWDRSAVMWDRSSPRLLGQQFANTDPIDFCGQRGIYVLYDNREVVYVGRATQLTLGVRLREHHFDRLRGRWNRFTWLGFIQVGRDGQLLAWPTASASLGTMIEIIESSFIEVFEPRQNRQQGKGFSAKEYIQVADPDIERQQRRQLALRIASEVD